MVAYRLMLNKSIAVAFLCVCVSFVNSGYFYCGVCGK